ncbi:DgyrCDS12283 [Dimorphilus gyrociliatus]|uniref:arylamine N-acetyltransferase n=1 Tax=Dimorphilus gyrociliatus TaxID=2664684 RepID=A0A7I8W622_9ANNE|nr:DgyrCDS12283 [Dimorphilus gyrociliatus]
MINGNNMFTVDETLNILKNILYIEESDIEEYRKGKNQLEFLNKIIRSFQENIPFHNIFALASTRKARPSLDDIKTRIQNGSGGLCFVNNVGIYFLLDSLNFNVSLALSSVSSPDNHLVVLVNMGNENKSLESSDKVNLLLENFYLVECGCGYPSFTAVPLKGLIEEGSESEIYKESFLTYKFERDGDLILRMHGRGFIEPKTHQASKGTDFKRFYDFRTTAIKSIDELLPYFDKVFNDENEASFICNIRAIRFPSGKAIGMRDNFLLEEENNVLRTRELKDNNDIVRHLQIILPKIPLSECIQAVQRLYNN